MPRAIPQAFRERRPSLDFEPAVGMKGSMHQMSDGIGRGMYCDNDRAYYNVKTPRERNKPNQSNRPLGSIGGVETHRSDISFGHPDRNWPTPRQAVAKAQHHTAMLTSGEVGSFQWDRRFGGGRELMMTAAVRASVDPQTGQSCSAADPDSWALPSQRSGRSSVDGSRCGSRASRRSARGSSGGGGDKGRESTAGDVGGSGRRESIPLPESVRDGIRHGVYAPSGTAAPGPSSSDEQAKGGGKPRAQRKHQGHHHGHHHGHQGHKKPITIARTEFGKLDASFERYRKYDVMASTTEGPLTNRYGPVVGEKVVSINQTTTEINSPWSRVLRGLKY